VLFLADAGEWVPASLFMGLAFLVAALGVVGLGWYVMRGDSLNRRLERPSAEDRGEQH
jgi:hypothetical protein